MGESPRVQWIPAGRSLGAGEKLSLPLSLATPGSFRVWLRARGTLGAARVALRLDEANPFFALAPLGPGFHWAPAHAEKTQSLQIVSGKKSFQDGALALRAEGTPAAALLGASLVEGRAQASLAVAEPARGARIEPPGAYFFLSETGARTGIAAGIALNPGRFVIAALREGRMQALAEKPGPVEPGRFFPLRFEIARGKLRLFEGAELRVESDAPEAMRQFGWLATQAEARVRDAALEEQGRLLFASSFAPAKPLIPIGAGEHRLEIEAVGGAVEIEAAMLAEDEALASIPPQTLRWARAASFDLWGRPPREPEALAAARSPAQETARTLLRDPQFWQRWFEEELYYFLLIDNFRPSGDLLRSVPARLQAGEISVREALWQICICPEFNARNPGSDTFVTVVLEQLLGITVQKQPSMLEAGKKLYDGYPGRFLNREGRSQSDVVKAIFDHPDFPGFYLARVHQRLLGEPMPAAKRKEWSERFAGDPRSFVSILEEWLGSESYSRRAARPRPKSDSMFLESLFQDLLRRPPTQQEHRNLFNAMQALSDSSAIRMVIVKMLLDSGKVELPEKEGLDLDAWLQSWFVRLLSRTPTAKEGISFANLWKDPKCTPKLVLQALATHPEYQMY